MKVIGICGVSGSGKSTVANFLATKYTDRVTLLSLDDYFKTASEIGIDWREVNWEEPSVIKFESLIQDINNLKAGKSIKVFSKSSFYNPDFDYDKYNKIEVEIFPKELIILEGFLIFANEELRDLIDIKIYLDLSITDGLKRRMGDKNKLTESYIQKSIIPSFTKYIIEKKKFADYVIDTSSENQQEVINRVEKILNFI